MECNSSLGPTRLSENGSRHEQRCEKKAKFRSFTCYLLNAITIVHYQRLLAKSAFHGRAGPSINHLQYCEYQKSRLSESVTPRTVNLEVGVLRSILKRFWMWEAIAPDIDFLKENTSPGRALSADEEKRLLDARQKAVAVVFIRSS